MVKLVEKALGGLKGKHIAALGLSYKPDVDDLRESPAVEIVHLLNKAGAIVTAYEPFKKDAQLPGVHSVESLSEAIRDAEALLLLVNHTELRNLDFADVVRQTAARTLIDTVNGWAGANWQEAGFKLFRLGNGKR